MVPIRFIQTYSGDAIEILYDKKENTINCYMTWIGNQYVPLIKVYPERNQVAALLDFLHKNCKYFEAEIFSMDSSKIENGTGTILLTGEEFPDRVIQVELLHHYVIHIKDSLQELKQAATEKAAVAENDQYTELVSENFRIRLFADKKVMSNQIITARAEIEYIGPKEEIELYHSDPCFTIFLSGGKYHIGGMIHDVGIKEIWKKGEVHQFTLVKGGGWDSNAKDAKYWEEFYSTPELLLPPGEYSITGQFEATDGQNGKQYNLTVTRKLLVLN